MRDDGTLAAGVIEEGTDGVSAARSGSGVGHVFFIGIVESGSESGVAGTDESAVLTEVSVGGVIAPHVALLDFDPVFAGEFSDTHGIRVRYALQARSITRCEKLRVFSTGAAERLYGVRKFFEQMCLSYVGQQHAGG